MSTLTLVMLLCAVVVLLPKPVRRTGGGDAYVGIGWLVLLAVAIVTTVLTAVLTPKPKEKQPASVNDLENPTNDAGREMMVVFGEGVVKSPNILWYGDKGVNSYKVKV